MDFIYVKIPASEALANREHTIHEALETALAADAAGALIGWGASLEGVPKRRPVRVAFHRIDIEAPDARHARGVLRRALASLNLPPGTELHYSEDGVPLQERLDADGWSAPQALLR
ncbi:hypothetical protein [Niveibacterium sp.]|uniref:hypothetical protein n=1 Tax=Niveibacterium sp. TaxID=2017444 RepID=UPI0035AF04F0